MKKLKKGLILGMALGLTLSVTGCGSKPSASTSTSSNAPVTINVWGSVPTTAQWTGVYDEFKKEYPNIKVNYWRGESSDYNNKLQVAMAGGQGPDVLWLQPDLVKKYQNFLVDLGPLASKAYGANWKDDEMLSPTFLPEISADNGNVVALPTLVSGEPLVLYNKTIFDKYGIKTMPKTLNEWISVCKTLKANGVIPVATGLKDSWMDNDLFLTLNAQVAPGSIYDAINGKLPFTDQKLVDTMKLFKTVYNAGIFEPGSLGIATYPDARDQYYYSTKAAMFLTGSWHVGSYAVPGGEKFQNGVAIGKDQTGAFIFPQCGPDPTQTFESVDTSFGINSTSKYKDAAWKFVNFMFKGKGEQMMIDTLQGFPAIKNAKVSDSVMASLAPSDKDAVNMALKAFEKPIGIRTIPYTAISNAISVAMQNVATGSQDPATAMKSVEQASQGVTRK